MTTHLNRFTVASFIGIFLLGLLGPIGVTTAKDSTSTLSGKVLRKTSEGTKPLKGVLVLLEGVPKQFSEKKAPKPVINQVSQTFEPHILPVRTGESVKFMNSEMVTHNVRLVRKKTEKQLMNKMTFSGQATNYTFKKPGVVSVNCDIHPSMLAYTVAVDSPFVSAKTENKGTFSIKLPSNAKGSLTVRAWSENFGFSQAQTIKSGDFPTSIRITYTGK